MSGSFYTNSYDDRYLTFSWNLNRQSIESNQSVIDWKVTGSGGSSYTWYMAGNFLVKINGSAVFNSSTRIQLYNGTVVASGQITIDHNGDGTGGFNAYVEAGIYYYAVNCYGNGSWSLPTIPRATQPSVNKSNVTYEEEFIIDLPRASSRFTHTIQAGVNGTFAFAEIANNIQTQYRFSIPKEWAKYLPSSQHRVRIRVITFDGNTEIGSKEIQTPLSVRPTDDMKPIVNLTLSDETKLKDKYGGFIKGQSKIQATVSEQLYLGTGVQSRTLVLDGITYQTSKQTSQILTSTKQTVRASVTDERGMTGVVEETPLIYDWAPPLISSIHFQRCKKNGIDDEEGDFIKVVYDISISPINQRNTKSIRVGVKRQSSDNYNYQSVRVEQYQKKSQVIVPASGEYSWDIVFEVSDAFTTSRSIGQVGTASVLMDFHYSGRGMAIGKVSEQENCLELSPKWTFKLEGKPLEKYIKQIVLGMYPVGSIYFSTTNTDPSTFIGGTWTRFGQGRTLVGLDEKDSKFSTSEKIGGSIDLPLPEVGGLGAGNHPSYLNSNVMSKYGSEGRGWDVHTSNEMKPTIRKVDNYDKLQPYITVYMWKRTA